MGRYVIIARNKLGEIIKECPQNNNRYKIHKNFKGGFEYECN
jgi:hypothetical protein